MDNNEALAKYLVAADRLHEITQRVGFTLWQLQELEGLAATYFVLLAQAKRGMGKDAGELLLVAAKKNTFGATIRELERAALLSGDLGQRFRKMLRERNWLVHSSRADSRSAIYADSEFAALLFRLDGIAEEALALLKEIGDLAEKHVLSMGVSAQRIDRIAAELLQGWRDADAM